ncbi:MAG: omptin family outer membrane protease [Kiritimatiellae bacterium]|nr:omptin family outer membrane protease [Kiritimatiellia bacterium]
MKTPISRHAPFVAAALALAAASASAAGFRAAPVASFQEGDFSFGLSAGTTFVGGEAREHVFAPKGSFADYLADFPGAQPVDRRHQISRLDWDIAAAMVGLSGAARYDRLSLNFGVWHGGSGSDDYDMKDYDWMDGDHVPHTEYSRSDTELVDAWMFDVNVSWDLWRSDDFTGYVFAGAREQRWKWTCDGRNDYWYSENGHVWAHDKAHVCDYRQVLFFGYVGLGGTWKLSDALDLSAYASWAPGWKGRDRDNHIGADKMTIDSFDYDSNVYAAGLSLDWHVAEKATLSFGLDWQKATLNQGDLRQTEFDSGEKDSMPGGAGMENEYLAFTIALDYAF